jgi:2-polyprenyl-3-methyl-5-hydroxy-6-metoxy-1,4-benzoquinol methylase
MNLNFKYCESNDITFIQEKYKNIIEMFVTKSDDCLFKNFSIYDFIIKNNLFGKKCMDIGAGTSGLGYILCDRFEEVIIVDMAEKNNFHHKNLKHIRANFFEYADILEDNSFDLIVESCAITHFEHNTEENTGLQKCASIIQRILKPDSYFIMSSDVISEDSTDTVGQKEFIKASEIINIFANNGLKLINTFNYNTINNNCVIKLNYNKNLNFTLNYANFVFKKGL